MKLPYLIYSRFKIRYKGLLLNPFIYKMKTAKRLVNSKLISREFLNNIFMLN